MIKYERIKELEAEVAALKAELAEATTPNIFWDNVLEQTHRDLSDAAEFALGPGLHVFQVTAARTLPPVWVFAQVTEDDDSKITEFKTKAEAEAALQAAVTGQ